MSRKLVAIHITLSSIIILTGWYLNWWELMNAITVLTLLYVLQIRLKQAKTTNTKNKSSLELAEEMQNEESK